MALYTAKDIPGKNTFTPDKVCDLLEHKKDEEVFCSDEVSYYGQPLALVVASSEHLANIAAEKVKVIYKNTKKSNPIVSVRQALKSPDLTERMVVENKMEPKEKGTDVAKVIKGSFDFQGQYHYTMETQTCVVVPVEDGLDIYCATQWMDMMQVAVSRALNIPENR